MIHVALLRHGVRSASHGLGLTLAFSGSIAALLTLIGVQDLENYETAFVSLDRGTALDAVKVLGHPVYTQSLGLGVRLPLHGSLGASPAALVSPYLPEPLTYWLMLTIAIGSAVLVVRHALEPRCGQLISWVANVLLFCSPPVVAYTLVNDWPETAVTYCAVVACVFAPHALLLAWDSQDALARRAIASVSLAGLVWSLIGGSHPGYWPILGGTLVLTAVLALLRSEHPIRTRLTVVAALGVVATVAVMFQVLDLVRELQVAGPAVASMTRFVQGPAGALLTENAFPFPLGGRASRLGRGPFMFLAMTFVSIGISFLVRDPRRRALTIGSAVAAIACGVGAATLEPGSAVYAPSATFALRDPAIAFAVLAAAFAASAVQFDRFRFGRPTLAPLVFLALAGLQGLLYTADLIGALDNVNLADNRVNPRALSSPTARAAERGLTLDLKAGPKRLAFWPKVRSEMRDRLGTSTDFADAGYSVVTILTKQRTMRSVVEEPNETLFHQAVVLSQEVLCDAAAVQFLQLRYLLVPKGGGCAPWSAPIPGVEVDGWLSVLSARTTDDRAWALPIARLSDPLIHEPALSDGSGLLPMLRPLSNTSVDLRSLYVVVRQEDLSATTGYALVLPIAYDSAWTASSGRLLDIGGLLALVGGGQWRVVLTYVPDVVATLRALSMSFAQFLGGLGLLGLAYVGPTALHVERRMCH